jgi:hypothetical protein
MRKTGLVEVMMGGRKVKRLVVQSSQGMVKTVLTMRMNSRRWRTVVLSVFHLENEWVRKRKMSQCVAD